MKKRTRSACLGRYLLPAIMVVLAGCQGSSRTVNLGSKEITTQNPIQLDSASMPIAASRDGSRLAVWVQGAPGRTKIDVIDTEDRKVLGTLDAPNGQNATTIFSRDGSVLYTTADDGYIAWNYTTGSTRKIAEMGPKPREFNLLDDNGWNYDRSIAIAYPQDVRLRRENSIGRQREAGQVATEDGITHEIPVDATAGFDQYGYAWFGKGHDWSKVDRAGRLTRSKTRPKFLVHDQTADRGSLHLRSTAKEMRYRDGRAFITCVWLTDDRATPYSAMVKGKVVKVNQNYQAAVVFAGPDIFSYGFLPGRDMVYVASGFGFYLVPFKTVPVKKPSR